MNNSILLLSFLICGVGLTLGFVLLNPFGFVIDGIGIMIFFYAIFDKRENHSEGYILKNRDKKDNYRNYLEEDYKCRNCFWFGKPGCKRQEKLLNAEPCQDFMKK
jgi:hypothetical protein